MSAALSIEARAVRLFGARVRFGSAAEAVIWAVQALDARRDGVVALRAVCAPEDVLKCLDRLYRQRSISLAHARVLRVWGERGREPCSVENRGDRRLWDEVIPKLKTALRIKGIVQ